MGVIDVVHTGIIPQGDSDWPMPRLYVTVVWEELITDINFALSLF